MAITINGSTGIEMASDDSLGFGDIGLSADTLFAGRKNVIINGDFDVWQRGTSQTSAGYGSADRYYTNNNTSSFTVSQQSFALGQTSVPNEPKYFSRCSVTTASLAGSFVLQYQAVESVRTLAGQTATLSFWAKADASKNIAIEFNQYFGTGGSPSANVTGIGVTTLSLTASWQKFEVTVSIPSISGKTLGTNNNDCLLAIFWLEAGSDFNARTNNLGNQSGTFDIAQVQLEKGSQATAFEKRSYGEELALCQRYYWQVDDATGYTAEGYIDLSTYERLYIKHPVTMRETPTATGGLSNLTANVRVGDSLAVAPFNADTSRVAFRGASTGRAYAYGGSGDTLTFDAEL